MKIMYHATDLKNLGSILVDGLEPSFGGIVYLAETPKDALKFVAFRNYKEILLVKVKIYKKDEDKLVETFDHSYEVFKCRSFGYLGKLSADKINPYMKYENPMYVNN